MANIILSYTILEAKKDEYIEAYCYIHKNTEMTDDEEPVAKYTDSQWVREHIKRYIKGQIIRGKNAKSRDVLIQQNADDVT